MQAKKGKEEGLLVPCWVSTWSFSSVPINWVSPHPSSAVIQIFFLLSHRSSFSFELSISVGEFHLPLPVKALSKPSNYKLNITSGEYKCLHCAYFQWYFSIPPIIILQATNPFFNMGEMIYLYYFLNLMFMCFFQFGNIAKGM